MSAHVLLNLLNATSLINSIKRSTNGRFYLSYNIKLTCILKSSFWREKHKYFAICVT